MYRILYWQVMFVPASYCFGQLAYHQKQPEITSVVFLFYTSMKTIQY